MDTLFNPPLQPGLESEPQFFRGESAEELDQLQAEYYDRFRPSAPEQRFQVDNLIRNEWLLRRLFRVEARLWEHHALQAGHCSGVQLTEALSKAGAGFTGLQRRADAEKAYQDAMSELTRLQQPAQPRETKSETPKLASFLATASAPRAASRSATLGLSSFGHQ